MGCRSLFPVSIETERGSLFERVQVPVPIEKGKEPDETGKGILVGHDPWVDRGSMVCRGGGEKRGMDVRGGRRRGRVRVFPVKPGPFFFFTAQRIHPDVGPKHERQRTRAPLSLTLSRAASRRTIDRSWKKRCVFHVQDSTWARHAWIERRSLEWKP